MKNKLYFAFGWLIAGIMVINFLLVMTYLFLRVFFGVISDYFGWLIAWTFGIGLIFIFLFGVIGDFIDSNEESKIDEIIKEIKKKRRITHKNKKLSPERFKTQI